MRPVRQHAKRRVDHCGFPPPCNIQPAVTLWKTKAAAREGGSLAGILAGEGMDFFYAVGEAEFENRLRHCRLTFVRDERGRVRGFEVEALSD